MVTIQVPNLIDFVAEVFNRADSSPEEARRIATYLTTANLTGHDSHGVIRVPVYIRWKKTGSVVPNQTAELVVDTPSLAVVDGKFGYGQTVAPQAVRIGIENARHRALRPWRCAMPGISAGSATGPKLAAAEGPGFDSLRQRGGFGTGRALWRRRAAALHRALLRRHPAPGARAGRAGFCDLDRRRRQGAGCKPWRQEVAQGRADRSRRQFERRSGRAVWTPHGGRTARPQPGQGRDPRLR